MEKQKAYEYYLTHKAELLGALIGLIIAIVILSIGFFKTIFVVICMFIGYIVGKKLSIDRNFFNKVLDKIFPPGIYR